MALDIFFYIMLSIDIEMWIIDIIVLGKLNGMLALEYNDPDTIK